MDIGENLSLGMLSEDNTSQDFGLDIKEEDLMVDLDGTQKPEEKPKEDQEITISEEVKTTPESVADEEDKSKASDAEPSPDGDKSSQLYSSLATHLHESGVLPSLNSETKINNFEDLQSAIKAEIDNGLEESVKQYREAIDRGEPEDAYVRYTRQKEQLDAITDETLSNEQSATLRYNIIAQDFLNKGFSRDDALKYAKRSQDLGEDVDDAKAALAKVKEFNTNTYQNSVKEKRDLEKANEDKIKGYVNSTDEIIKGIKLNQATKDNLLKQMTTSVGRDKNGNPLTKYGKALVDDPVKTKAVTEYMFLITNGFTDFSKLNNIISTKATKDFDDVLRNSGDFLSGGGPAKNSQTTFSFEDFKIDA